MQVIPKGQLIAEIRFGSNGNASAVQQGGWAAPEDGFTWTIGPMARLRVPVPAGPGRLMLVMDGRPFIAPPVHPQQRLRLTLGGQDFGEFSFNKEFVRCFFADESVVQAGALSISMSTPDNRAPETCGMSDHRKLAFAWHSIRLFRLALAAENDVPAVPVPPDLLRSRLAGLRSVPYGWEAAEAQLLDAALDGAFDQPFLGSGWIAVEKLVAYCLCRARTLPAAQTCQAYFAADIASIDYVRTEKPILSLVLCRLDDARRWHFSFPDLWLAGEPGAAVYRMMASRWMAMMPLLAAYAASSRMPGQVILSLGDEIQCYGIGFCGMWSDEFLIPDPDFWRSQGYRLARQRLRQAFIPFENRRSRAIWRGSPTGYRDDAGIFARTRVKLCQLAQLAAYEDYLDAGLTSLDVEASAADAALLRAAGLEKPFLPLEEMAAWQFQIDVDGQSNAWSGLFQKLLGGGLVFKVDSKGPWRQWYYGRLVPYENFVPVAAGLSDLLAKLKFYRYNQDASAQIAARGAALVGAMTYETETCAALAAIEAAMIQHMTWNRPFAV